MATTFDYHKGAATPLEAPGNGGGARTPCTRKVLTVCPRKTGKCIKAVALTLTVSKPIIRNQKKEDIMIMKRRGLRLWKGTPRFLLLCGLLSSVARTLEVTSPAQLRKHYVSSRYRYYGPQSGAAVEAPAIVLDGAELCNPHPDVVRGRIVVIGDKWPHSDDCTVFSSLG